MLCRSNRALCSVPLTFLYFQAELLEIQGEESNILLAPHFKKIYFIVVQLQLSPFSHYSPLSYPLPHSILPPPLLSMSMGPSYIFLDLTLPPFSPVTPLLSPLVTVCSLFPSLVLFCALVCFVDQVPLIGEIIWYLSFTAWIISLSIMLSSSIHAVMKGRNLFFLSAAQYSILKLCCVLPWFPAIILPYFFRHQSHAVCSECH